MQHCIGVVGTVMETGAYIVVLIVGVQKIMKGNRSWFTCCSVATIEMLFSCPLCGRFINDDTSCIASANRVFSFLDKRVANSNVERAMGMTLTNVSFQENDEEKCRIYNIDLQIKPGELIMIVGESGAGKTTLLKLMAGLYKPSNGSVAYYGNEARLTAVWQEPRFFGRQ